MVIKSVTPSPLKSLSEVFAAFIVCIFAFACVYYRLSMRPRNFHFNEEFLEKQRAIVKDEASSRLTYLTEKISLLCELRTAALQNSAAFVTENTRSEVRVPSGYRYVFEAVEYAQPGPPPPPVVILSVFDMKGDQVFGHMLSTPGLVLDREDVIAATAGSISEFTGECRKLQKRLGTLDSDPPDVWGFWDFLYFSTIIQTTIGLGDILPNSTVVRMLVVFQVMLGYGILIVALNTVILGLSH